MKIKNAVAIAGLGALCLVSLTACDVEPVLVNKCQPPGPGGTTYGFSWVLVNDTGVNFVVDDVTTNPALPAGVGAEWFEGQNLPANSSLASFTTGNAYYGQDTSISAHVAGHPAISTTLTHHAECDV